MPSRVRLFLVFSLLLMLALGCKKSTRTAQVHGKVTYKGKTVAAGTVTFESKDGGMYLAPIDTDGTYSARDIPPGEMFVTIETESANKKRQRTMADYRRGQWGGGAGGKGKKQEMTSPRPQDAPQTAEGAYVPINLKYSRKETSGLTLTLTAGDQEKDFHLE